LLTWLAYGAVVVLAARALTTVRRVRLFLGAILAASAVMAILGLGQHFGWSPVPEDFDRQGWARAWGTTGSPIALGAYLVLVLPVAIGLYARAPDPGRLWGYGTAVVLLYAALIATRTRAALGAFAIAVAVWALATGLRRLRARLQFLVVLGVALAVVTPVVLFTGSVPVSQISDRDSADSRAFLWRTTAPLVWQRPLFGWGPETLSQAYPDYKAPGFFRVFPRARMQQIIVDRPHNDLLQQAVSTGLVGLAAYLWLWGAVFRTGWRVARADREAALSVPSAGLAACLLGGAAGYFAQLQLSFSYVSVATVFWSLVGLLLALDMARPPVSPKP